MAKTEQTEVQSIHDRGDAGDLQGMYLLLLCGEEVLFLGSFAC